MKVWAFFKIHCSTCFLRNPCSESKSVMASELKLNWQIKACLFSLEAFRRCFKGNWAVVHSASRQSTTHVQRTRDGRRTEESRNEKNHIICLKQIKFTLFKFSPAASFQALAALNVITMFGVSILLLLSLLAVAFIAFVALLCGQQLKQGTSRTAEQHVP